jgi:hypothetical protein
MNPPDFDHKDSKFYRFPRQCPGLSRDLEPDSPPLERALGCIGLAAFFMWAGWMICKIGGG